MLVKQISVFVENEAGRLAELTKILADNGIDLKACTIAETVDFGILRCIVPEPDTAVKALNEKGFNASTAELIAVALKDTPGGLNEVLQILSAANVSVSYIYSTIRSGQGEAVIMMKTADPEAAVEVLKANDIKLLTLEELMR